MAKEVQPTAKLGKYKEIVVLRRPVQPTKKQVEEAMRVLRYRGAGWQSENGPAARRDQVVLDFAGFFPGNVPIPDSQAQNVTVILGQGKMLAGVEDAICGHRAGESFRIPVTYPDNFPLKSLAGRPVEFEITLHTVQRRQMPEADDHFAQAHGCANLEELWKRLEKQELDKNRNIERSRIETFLLAQAAAEMQVEFPAGYLETKAEQRVTAMEKDLAAAGQKVELYYRLTGHDRQWHLQRAGLDVEVEWRRRLAVEEIAKAEKLSVTAEEVQHELARLYEKNRETAKINPESVRQALLTRKVQQVLVQNAVYQD